MHQGSLARRRVRVPAAVVVCAVLGAIVVALIGVSLFVPSPDPQISAPPDSIVTAVTPTSLTSVAGPALAGR